MHMFLFLVSASKELARISNEYRTTILISSVLVAVACAALLLPSKEARRLAGSWVKYVGLAFLAYGFQYIFRLFGWLLHLYTDKDSFLFLKGACNFLANFGSGANNLFFLAAALILLNKRTRLLQPLSFITIAITTAALTTAANFYFMKADSPWAASLARLPDALISACCLGLFGYATMRNFLTHHRKYWAVVVILIGLFYGSVQLIYAANPVLANSYEAEIQGVLETVTYSPKPNPVEYLDSALFAVALPLKMLLFVPAFYLFFTLVIAAHDFRKVLRVVREQKKPYLSGDGIVEAVGRSVAANSVEVFIKLPGTTPPAAWGIPWSTAGPNQYTHYIVLDPKANPSVDRGLLEVFKGVAEVPGQDSSEWQRRIHTSLPPQSTEPSAMLPIRFHGAVIGCLKVTFNRARDFNYAAAQQLSSMADLLAPAVQDYRALASIDQLSDRYARLQVQKPGTDFKETTREMGSILHNVLSPLATGLLLEAGFQANHILQGEGEFLRLLEGQTVRYEPEDLTTEVIRTDTGEVRIHKNQLMVIPREDASKPFPIGNLVLILPNQKDEINHPTLGDYSLHRHTVASHTADAYLDLVRDHLRNEVSSLSIKLNAEALTQDAWLKGIQDMAHKVGLLWVGVTQTGSSRILSNDAFAAELIPKIDEEARRALEATPLSCVVFHDETTQTYHVMRIELKKSGHQIWFGIAREGFGFELDFPSPWKVFLEDFQEIVDSALASLFEIQKSKETLAKLAEDRGVMSIAITTGHLMHELGNKIDAQQLSAAVLWENVEAGKINADANQRARMSAILKGATVMKELIAIFRDVTRTNEQSISRLRDVVARATEFYEQIIPHNNIKIRNKVKEDLWIAIRFDVALFAIANLVGNAKEAIEKRLPEIGDGEVGEIRIEGRTDGDYVICHIIDNGVGIPDHIRDELYQLGSSDKKGHNGWGLYFTKRSLDENRSEIKLIESSTGHTKFSLKFPKAKSP